VTILITDLEDSTRRWEEDPDLMDASLVRHDAILRTEIERCHGVVAKHTGDGVLALFDAPSDAVQAAVASQVALRAEPWAGAPLRVRMGINTGEARLRGGDAFGPSVNLAARIEDAAHGGQILVSATTAALIRDVPAPSTTTADLGHWQLRNVHAPQRLFEVRHPALPDQFPRPRATRPGRSSLPVLLSTFIDPRGEVARLAATLATSRLVTVIGPGGVGKSRLAIEVATRVEDDYADGARWCPLADVDDPSLVPAAVASHLDLGQTALSTDGVLEALSSRHLLLLVDNCEHVQAAAKALIDRILRNCPLVTVLATSREPLRLDGERVSPLRALTSKHHNESSAVELFLDRAASAGADLDVTDAGRRRIAALCERLDGLPLAIELAAARTRELGLDELERRLDERFQLLAASGMPDVSTPAHHQRLHDTVAWSYELLDEREQLLFARLAVFRGGFTPDAAEVVCGEVGIWGDLAGLAERSLIQLDVGSPVTRYELLESVRAFALERLTERGEEGRTAERHARWFCAFAERADRERAGPNEAEWVERELAEIANLRAATAWSVEHDQVDLALRLYVSLYELASLQGRVEIFDWIDPLSFLDTDHDLVPPALAMAALRQDPSMPASVERAELAINLQQERGSRPHRLLPWAKGFAESSRGEVKAAIDAYREAAAVILAVEGENGHWISARALVAIATRDLAEAQQVAVDSLRVGQPSGRANAFLALARSTTDDGASALELTRRAYALAASVQNLRVLAYADLTAAGIAVRDAAPDVALGHLTAALSNAVQARHHEPMWHSVIRIGDVLRRAGFDAAASDVVGAWMDAFPEAAARYAAQRPRERPMRFEAGVVEARTERELCDRTITIVEELFRDLQPPAQDLPEEGRAVGE
jgi:predicted ATPase/class 3 adenylate cyclase